MKTLIVSSIVAAAVGAIGAIGVPTQSGPSAGSPCHDVGKVECSANGKAVLRCEKAAGSGDKWRVIQKCLLVEKCHLNRCFPPSLAGRFALPAPDPESEPEPAPEPEPRPEPEPESEPEAIADPQSNDSEADLPKVGDMCNDVGKKTCSQGHKSVLRCQQLDIIKEWEVANKCGPHEVCKNAKCVPSPPTPKMARSADAEPEPEPESEAEYFARA